uniref:uncharacterized protein LOC109960355 n=1 Tax=Monopterus albus TaxID=43700 RepID=UPI0009B4A8BD|nr:uncharacterized protein LOC109960355 [Monopterus albus]
MTADKWIFVFALCFMSASSNDERKSCIPDICQTHMLSAPLGSSVLLPCHFTSNKDSWVSWAHPVIDLVNLTSKGFIKFLDPKSGRLKVFPNQASMGNYTIRIDELEVSDLGCYRCVWKNNCHQVELVAETYTLSKDIWLWIYICAGVATFFLLSVCLISLFCRNRKQYNTNNPVRAGIEVHSSGAIQGPTTGASAPPEEIGSAPVQRVQQVNNQHHHPHVLPFPREANTNNLVYENDDQVPANWQGDPARNHSCLPGVLPELDRPQTTPSTSGIYPNLDQFNGERLESQTRRSFHREFFNRLRQASRRYYANQSEINRQQALSAQAEHHRRGVGKKKAKDKCEYQNPIYNRSTDHLDQL